MSVLERCLSYRESNKESKERQGPTLGVCFTEVSVKRESRLHPCFKQKWSNCTCLIELQWQQLFSLMDDCDTKNFTPFVMFVFNDYTIPRLIQTLFLNFDGILTRYLLPSGVSASWRLLPRLPKILNNIDRYFSRDKFFLKWRNYTVALLAK